MKKLSKHTRLALDFVWEQRNKLRADGAKLWADGYKLWADGVLRLAGNIEVGWVATGCRLETGDEFFYVPQPTEGK